MTWSIWPIEGMRTIYHAECTGTDVIGGEFQPLRANQATTKGCFLSAAAERPSTFGSPRHRSVRWKLTKELLIARAPRVLLYVPLQLD